MNTQAIIEFLEQEISNQRAIAEGIEGGDRWWRDHGNGKEDMTEATLMECRRKIQEASQHLERLRGG